MTRVISLIDPKNAPSIRVAQRLGMTHERDVEWREARFFLYSKSR
jgi:RimJ/RimL family protein N-acetyltransferase